MLEVVRREFGGRCQWHDGHNQPVLVVPDSFANVCFVRPWKGFCLG